MMRVVSLEEYENLNPNGFRAETAEEVLADSLESEIQGEDFSI